MVATRACRGAEVEVSEVVGLQGPVRARADRRALADHSRNARGVGDCNALAPVGAEGLLLARGAPGTLSCFVKEGERLLVEVATIFLGNGDELVVLGMDEVGSNGVRVDIRNV